VLHFSTATASATLLNRRLHTVFGKLSLPLKRVFITENEISLLAFPNVRKSIAVFGAGYGFDMLAQAHWLTDCEVYYWGDIDTHGFAILDQLRAHVPHAQSLLMDRETLLCHRQHWGNEPRPESRDLLRLRPAEAALYDDIRFNRLGMQVRLEQEKISFAFIREALEVIVRNV